MEAKKIIIVSCGRTTDVMIDGELYFGITAVSFSHKGGKINELQLTGDPIPVVDNDPVHRAGFMQKIAEFSKSPENHSQKGEKEVEKLKALCQPIVEWLEKNHDPYTQVQITSDNIELVQKTVGIPLKEGDEKSISDGVRIAVASALTEL